MESFAAKPLGAKRFHGIATPKKYSLAAKPLAAKIKIWDILCMFEKCYILFYESINLIQVKK
jgi:hypothetical protein